MLSKFQIELIKMVEQKKPLVSELTEYILVSLSCFALAGFLSLLYDHFNVDIWTRVFHISMALAWGIIFGIISIWTYQIKNQ